MRGQRRKKGGREREVRGYILTLTTHLRLEMVQDIFSCVIFGSPELVEECLKFNANLNVFDKAGITQPNLSPVSTPLSPLLLSLSPCECLLFPPSIHLNTNTHTLISTNIYLLASSESIQILNTLLPPTKKNTHRYISTA